MKIKTYVEDLRTKSAAELNDELVAAKKEEVSPPAGTGRWKGYERRNCCGKKFKKNTYR